MANGTKSQLETRADHEIEHGRRLAEHDPETVWGWGTPAGKLRAERRAAMILQAAQLRPGLKALEIGCGTGNFTERFAAGGAEILAVDISPDLLERAKTRELPPDRVRFECKRFENCEIDGPFDAVIGSSILHHLHIEPALRKIYALLEPGGRMSFAEPNMLNPQVFAERNFRFLGKVFWYCSPDETAFVRWKFARQLRNAGFDQIHITPFDWLHPATPRPLIRVVRGVGTVFEHLPLIREFSGSVLIAARRPPREPTTAEPTAIA